MKKNVKNVKKRDKNKKGCKRNKKRYLFLVYFNSTPDAQEMAFKATNSEYAIQCSFAETVVVLGYQ